MKLFFALWLTLTPTFASTFIEFECLDLPATGIAEIEIHQRKEAIAYVWLESRLTSRASSGLELIGKSRLVEARRQKPYYDLQLKTVENSQIETVRLQLGHQSSLSSHVRLKNGRVFSGKCRVK